MGDDLPPLGLEGALCGEPLAPTLGLQRKDYWEEVNPLLVEWKNVNDSKCPKCDRSIRVNMARHLRLCHTTTRSPRVCYGSRRSSTAMIILRGLVRAAVICFTSAFEHMDWSGSAAGRSSINVKRPHKRCGWTWPWLAVPARSSTIPTLSHRVRSSPRSGDSS